MNIDKYVLAQLVSFLDRSKFNRIFEEFAYCMVTIVQHDLHIDKSIYDVLRFWIGILRIRLCFLSYLTNLKSKNSKIILVQVNQICFTFNYVQIFSGLSDITLCLIHFLMLGLSRNIPTVQNGQWFLYLPSQDISLLFHEPHK